MTSTVKHAAVACLLLAMPAFRASAALSEPYHAWRSGPVQWIMTSEEQKAWKVLGSDEEAIRFIDLFWVRRDPTPGTPRNTYKEEFTSRVQLSDSMFGESRKRGSLSDRGRVYIVLGHPTVGMEEAGGSGRHHDPDDFLSTRGTYLTRQSHTPGQNRLRGGRSAWTWDRADAMKKFGLPKVEVVFTEEAGTGKVIRDPHRPDFVAAAPIAIRRAIVSPDLAEVPAWALQGGLEEKVIIAETVIPPAPPPAQTAAAQTAGPSTAGVTPAAAPGAIPAPPLAPAAGARLSRLTFIRGVFAVHAELKDDPFTKMTSVATFQVDEDLGWVARYCSGSEDEPTLSYGLRLTGQSRGEVIDRAAPPDQLVPDRIKAVSGCYLMRGVIPLEGMRAGDYQLELTVQDPATSENLVIAQRFEIR